MERSEQELRRCLWGWRVGELDEAVGVGADDCPCVEATADGGLGRGDRKRPSRARTRSRLLMVCDDHTSARPCCR